MSVKSPCRLVLNGIAISNGIIIILLFLVRLATEFRLNKKRLLKTAEHAGISF